LKEKCLFDNFIIGDCNKLAQEASVYVAKNPGKEYNPLFIWGDKGVGKTHLLHAIKNSIIELYPEKLILYVEAERFTKEVVNSIRYGTMSEFREKYRTVDVLLLDNMQYFMGKRSTQEEFFHTFNSLFSEGKQIVIMADIPPKEMNHLDEKFRSRLSCGLIVHVEELDYSTRIEIIQKLARRYQVIIEQEASDYIAASMHTSFTELVDMTKKVISKSEHNYNKINKELAIRTIVEMKQKKDEIITLELILHTVAEYFKLASEDLVSVKKGKELLYSRQIAMYLCNKMTNESLSSIGKVFGKNHSTVKNGIDKITLQLTTNSETSMLIETLRRECLYRYKDNIE
jgi:chromosomal replication initiator protein